MITGSHKNICGGYEEAGCHTYLQNKGAQDQYTKNDSLICQSRMVGYNVKHYNAKLTLPKKSISSIQETYIVQNDVFWNNGSGQLSYHINFHCTLISVYCISKFFTYFVHLMLCGGLKKLILSTLLLCCFTLHRFHHSKL